MASETIPVPPFELRALVGPLNPADYDNPTRTPLLYHFGVPVEAYATVFDFGCGCGRQARQLLQQDPRPRRYLGVDVRRDLVDWCRQNLTPVDPAFEFLHHDVYSPWYARHNALQLSQPLPAADGSVSLVIATSVFTHVTRAQVEYYLSEIARILAPGGIAFTSWLLFDRNAFPFLPDVYALHVDPMDFALAALFDREWLLAAIRGAGLGVTQTVPPDISGLQWNLLLARRAAGMQDRFPLGADGSGRLSGATLECAPPGRPPAAPLAGSTHPAAPPALTGTLAEVDRLRRELDVIKRSRAWAIGRAVTSPARMLRKLF